MADNIASAPKLYVLWRGACRFFTYWFIALRLYKLKSWVYRRIWEKKFLNVQMGMVQNLDLIPPIIDFGRKWRSDSWKQGFDAVSSPQFAQEVFLGRVPVPKHGLDCDEHAIYITALVEKSLANHMCKEDGIAKPRFFTVTWMDPRTWKPGGHNVCLMEVPQRLWQFPKYCYMDYGTPHTTCDSIHAVALQVIERYAKGSEPLVWAVQRTDLTPEMVQWGTP